METRKATLGKQMAWTKEEVDVGVRRFMEEHGGRFPMSTEFDEYDYLPSCRSIQRSFGGLIALKNTLGISYPNYHQGIRRQELAHKVGIRGIQIEDQLGLALVARFGEFAVHFQSRMAGCRERLDFIVYYDGGKFGVDIFYAENRASLTGSIVIKQHKYKIFNSKLYFVCDGKFSKQELLELLSTKKHPLLPNIELIGEEEFLEILKMYQPLRLLS